MFVEKIDDEGSLGECRGFAKDRVWVKAGLSEEKVIEVVAHEVFHRAQHDVFKNRHPTVLGNSAASLAHGETLAAIYGENSVERFKKLRRGERIATLAEATTRASDEARCALGLR